MSAAQTTTLDRSLTVPESASPAGPAPSDDARDQPLPLRLGELPQLLHPARITSQGLSDPKGRQATDMLRKLLWSGLYAGLAAGTALVARQAASGLWRIATGEPPPDKS